MRETGLVKTVKFVTAHDDRVCEICRPLNGRTWDVNSSKIKQPPVHPNCRCILNMDKLK